MYKKYDHDWHKVIVFHKDDHIEDGVFVICDHPANDETIEAINDAFGTSITEADLAAWVPNDENDEPKWGYLENPLAVDGLPFRDLWFIWHCNDGLDALTHILYWQDFLTPDQMVEIVTTAQSYFQ